jgi:hypothetical protein
MKSVSTNFDYRLLLHVQSVGMFGVI